MKRYLWIVIALVLALILLGGIAWQRQSAHFLRQFFCRQRGRIRQRNCSCRQFGIFRQFGGFLRSAGCFIGGHGFFRRILRPGEHGFL